MNDKFIQSLAYDALYVGTLRSTSGNRLGNMATERMRLNDSRAQYSAEQKYEADKALFYQTATPDDEAALNHYCDVYNVLRQHGRYGFYALRQYADGFPRCPESNGKFTNRGGYEVEGHAKRDWALSMVAPEDFERASQRI